MSLINQHLRKAVGSRVRLSDSLVRGMANKPNGEIRLSDLLFFVNEYDLTQLSSAITAANGWVNDPVMGWRRDSYAWSNPLSLTLPSGSSISKLRRVEGVFHGYYNTPANCIGQNRIIIQCTDGTTYTLGTQDAWDAEASGQDLYLGDEGYVPKSRSDMVNRRLGITLPADKIASQLLVYSSGFSESGINYPISKRGIKDLKFFFKE